MELEQIKAIISMMKENDLSEFSMEQDGLKIRIKRGPEGYQTVVAAPAPAPITPAPVAAPAGPATAHAAPAAAAATVPADTKHITSPMVGTLYRSPSPEAPPYVEVGSVVDEDTVVCLIEAMKVMNEIKAEAKGVITEVIAENAKPVEFGQKLFAVKTK
jgi:acetyl-CoA carboxylase biotin carboxyl carrier protein